MRFYHWSQYLIYGIKTDSGNFNVNSGSLRNNFDYVDTMEWLKYDKTLDVNDPQNTAVYFRYVNSGSAAHDSLFYLSW